MNEILDLLAAGDSFAAIEHIQREGGALDVSAKYESLVSNLYWKARNLPAVIVIGRAGILYCLGQSLEPHLPGKVVDKLRSVAKGLAYDVGSFTWPGWEEPGINPTSEQQAVGRDCARLNLRLAIELKKPAARLSMAHWLVGAHALSAGDVKVAIASFQTSLDVLPQDDPVAKTLGICNRGYLAIARTCAGAAEPTAQKDLEEILATLTAKDDETSRSYLAQLQSARRLYNFQSMSEKPAN